tara:strand:+ start:45 stop:929 length:885 start_codon:yes stop_codon:yes gene_type:complete
MADKLLFNKDIKVKEFYDVLTLYQDIELKPYKEWLEDLKKNNNTEGVYIISENFKNILFFRPVPKDPELILKLKEGIIQKLNINEANIRLVKDEDTGYKGQGLDAATGIMNPIKITFNKLKLPFEDFFQIFNTDDWSWSLANDGLNNPKIKNLKYIYNTLGYSLPEKDSEGNISLQWEHEDEWFYDNEDNVIGLGYDDSIDINNFQLYFHIEEQSEQMRYLCFQFIMNGTDIIGFRFEHGSFDLIPLIFERLKPDVQFDWSIYWCLTNKDILINSDGNYNDFKDIVDEIGNVSW